MQGPGGSGKTFLYNLLAAHYRQQDKIVLCVASTGIAATLLSNGKTAHSTFKIPLELYEDSRCNVSRSSELAELFRKTHLIIWDEATNVSKLTISIVKEMLKDIRYNNLIFGGIPVVFRGNFQQIT